MYSSAPTHDQIKTNNYIKTVIDKQQKVSIVLYCLVIYLLMKRQLSKETKEDNSNMKLLKNCRLWYDLISRKELIREELSTFKYTIDVSCIDTVSKYHIKESFYISNDFLYHIKDIT